MGWGDVWDDALLRHVVRYVRGSSSLCIPEEWRPLIPTALYKSGIETCKWQKHELRSKKDTKKVSVNSRENSVNSRENSVNSRPPVWAWFSRVWKRILALVEHQCVELISCFSVLLRLLKNRGWLWSSQVGPGLVQPSNAVWALCPPFQWVWQRLMSLMSLRWNENLSSWRCGSGQVLAGYDRRWEKQISIYIYTLYNYIYII